MMQGDSGKKFDVGERLREERIRCGCGQEEFGAWLGGVSAKTVGNWERNVGAPDARQLAQASEHGVDVIYVLSGKHLPTAVEAPPASYTYDLAVQQVAPQPQEPASLNRDALRSAVLQVLAENQSGRSARTVGDTVDAIVEAYDRFRAIIGSPIGGALGSSRHPGTGTEG